MPMTDVDVEQLAAEVLTTAPDPAVDAAWRVEGLAALKTQEQRQMSEWRLARFLRDDAAMTAGAAALKKTRAAIGYLETPA